LTNATYGIEHWANGLAAFQAAPRCPLSTQGIGLRPQPWAPFSRPVGPDGPGHSRQMPEGEAKARPTSAGRDNIGSQNP